MQVKMSVYRSKTRERDLFSVKRGEKIWKREIFLVKSLSAGQSPTVYQRETD